MSIFLMRIEDFFYISEEDYTVFNDRVNKLKKELWGSTGVILHSRDIRHNENEFQILFDLDKKKYFIESLNAIIAESNYTIISAAIKKHEYITKYGPFGNVYSISLSFLLERAIFFLDGKPKPASLEIIVEKRGKLEDGELLRHYQTVHDKGTSYVSTARIKDYQTKLRFRSKKDNENGLQLADLVAYPIARLAKIFGTLLSTVT